MSPEGVVSYVGRTQGFIAKLEVDPAGNVYYTERCGHQIFKMTPSGEVSLVAGTGIAGHSGDGGPASEAQLAIPYSLWRDFDGTLLIGENGAMRVLRVDADGILTRVAGRVQLPVAARSGYGGPALEVRFYHTCGIASDPDGNVIVGAMEDNRLALVDPLGSVTGIAGSGEGGSWGSPVGDGGPALLAKGLCCEDLAVAADGVIYCSDLSTNEIRVLHREQF